MKCTFSNRQSHHQTYSRSSRRSQRNKSSSPRHPYTFITGSHRPRSRRSRREGTHQLPLQVITKPHLCPSPANVPPLMRLTQTTPAPPRSAKRRAATPPLRLRQRRLSHTPHRRSRIYRHPPHPRQDGEDTPEPVLMHLHGGQTGAALL